MLSPRNNQLLQRSRQVVARPVPRRAVLVVEERPFTADRLAGQLQAQGDVVVTWCRTVDGEVPCGGVVNERCPLKGPVGLVLDVRTGATPELTGREVGVACAGVAGIPVVAIGSPRPRPEDAPWALATCATDDAAGFARELLGHPRRLLELRLEDLVRRVLRLQGEDVGDAVIDVVRWPGATTVVVRTGTLPVAASCEAVDRAVRRALRAIVGADTTVGLSFTCSGGG